MGGFGTGCLDENGSGPGSELFQQPDPGWIHNFDYVITCCHTYTPTDFYPVMIYLPAPFLPDQWGCSLLTDLPVQTNFFLYEIFVFTNDTV